MKVGYALFLTLVVLFGISIFSAFIAYEFFTSKNGRLRILIIELFIAKVWTYGSLAVYLLLNKYEYVNSNYILYVIIVANFPMLIIMMRLYKYIRIHKQIK